jgi:hypothetical protein
VSQLQYQSILGYLFCCISLGTVVGVYLQTCSDHHKFVITSLPHSMLSSLKKERPPFGTLHTVPSVSITHASSRIYVSLRTYVTLLQRSTSWKSQVFSETNTSKCYLWTFCICKQIFLWECYWQVELLIVTSARLRVNMCKTPYKVLLRLKSV